MLYYGSKLIADQAPKGNRKDWNYNISEVYVIVLMEGFALPGHEADKRYLHDICLCNRATGEVFYEDLGFIYISLTNFAKEEDDLQNDLERWFYVLKNMARMDKLPVYLRKPVFQRLFDIAEYSKLSKEEKDMYDASLKRKWDAESVRLTAERMGMEKGRLEERIKAEKRLAQERAKAEAKRKADDIARAKKMLASGLTIELISDILGIPKEEIEALKREA